MEPTIITYTGDGKTKTFRFGFSFFQRNDIIVETNGAPTTARYALQISKPNPTADMPYTGGAVCFADAPAAGVEIKIYREFVLTRPVDYQATIKPKSHEMNQDSNFHLENIRDLRSHQHATDNTLMQHEIILAGHTNTLNTHEYKIAQIIERMSPDGTDISTTPGTPSVDLSDITADITQIKSDISTMSAQIAACAPQSVIAQIQSAITALDTRCENLDARITSIANTTLPDDADYVVESQMPTAANNYTWYRKYASGWVEQGGVWTGSKSCGGGREIVLGATLPVQMQDTNYYAGAMVSDIYLMHMGQIAATTSIQFRFGAYETTRTLTRFIWHVCGIGA